MVKSIKIHLYRSLVDIVRLFITVDNFKNFGWIGESKKFYSILDVNHLGPCTVLFAFELVHFKLGSHLGTEKLIIFFFFFGLW